jgi:hypothetical protein
MRGPGSGRWRKPKKAVPVEDCQAALDVVSLVRRPGYGPGRRGTLRWLEGSSVDCEVRRGPACELILVLRYTVEALWFGHGEAVEFPIRLTTREPHLRGWWGRCPLAINGPPCGRRVAYFYRPRGRRYFGCRVCYRLTYTSCQVSHQNTEDFVGALQEFAKVTGLNKVRRSTALRAVAIDGSGQPKGVSSPTA